MTAEPGFTLTLYTAEPGSASAERLRRDRIVDLAEDLDEDRRALALVAALAVDTTLKRDARGFSLTSLLS